MEKNKVTRLMSPVKKYPLTYIKTMTNNTGQYLNLKDIVMLNRVIMNVSMMINK